MNTISLDAFITDVEYDWYQFTHDVGCFFFSVLRQYEVLVVLVLVLVVFY